jgi:hypothetical protein
MSRIIKLFDDIQKRFPKAFISTPDKLLNSVFDFRLHERRVVPRIPYENFKSICRNAIRGDLHDMQLVSLLYAVGFGVPKNETMCMCWAQMSVLEKPCHDINEVFEALKTDVRNAKSDYVYPHYVTNDRASLVPTNTRIEESMFGRRMRIFPIYSGMPINLVYRFDGNSCYLYDAFNNVYDFSLEHLYRLDVPLTLDKYVPDYKYRVESLTDTEPHNMVISGTLVIPRSKMQYVRKRYPNTNSVAELFQLFVADKRDRHAMDVDALEKLTRQVTQIESKIEFIVSGEAAKSVNTQYKAEYALLESDPSDKRKSLLRDLQKQHGDLRNGVTLQTFQNELTVKKTQLAEFSESENELRYSYLENVFQFMPNDIYVTNALGAVTMPLRDNFKSHIQSLGFKIVGDLCHYADAVDVNELLLKFRHPEYALRAFNVRRVESVNNRTYTIALG